LRGAKHLIASLELGVACCRGFENDTAEFGTGDPWQWGLMLVFAADLKEIEEVGCRRVDSNEVFAGFWNWVGEVDYLEVLGALTMIVRRDTVRRRWSILHRHRPLLGFRAWLRACYRGAIK
jgi:hypothetical protein